MVWNDEHLEERPPCSPPYFMETFIYVFLNFTVPYKGGNGGRELGWLTTHVPGLLIHSDYEYTISKQLSKINNSLYRLIPWYLGLK